MLCQILTKDRFSTSLSAYNSSKATLTFVWVQLSEFCYHLATFVPIRAVDLQIVNLSFQGDIADMREGFRTTVRTNFLSLFLEPLLEANLAEMLTTAVCEVRFLQHLGADHTLVIIRELLDELILRHFYDTLRYRNHMIKETIVYKHMQNLPYK